MTEDGFVEILKVCATGVVAIVVWRLVLLFFFLLSLPPFTVSAAFDPDEEYDGVGARPGMTISQTYTIERMPASWWFTDNGDRLWFMVTNGSWGIVRGDGELILYPPFREGERNTRYEEMEMMRLWGTQYTQTADGIVQPAHKEQYPDKRIQKSGAIWGWIDVLGFTSSIKKNGTLYLPGNGSEYALVQYKTWEHWKTPPCRGNCYVFSWEHDLTVSDVAHGTGTEAKLTAVLVWYELICGESGCYRRYHTDQAVFVDQEASPEKYPALSEPTAIITQYNNTLYENIGIRVSSYDTANITKITFRYGDLQAVRNYQTIRVGQSIKNVSYGTLVDLEVWETEGAGISRFGNDILLDGNLTDMSIAEFEIVVHDPYTTLRANVSNFSILRAEFKPVQSFMNPVLFVFIAVLGVLGTCALYLLRRII